MKHSNKIWLLMLVVFSLLSASQVAFGLTLQLSLDGTCTEHPKECGSGVTGVIIIPSTQTCPTQQLFMNAQVCTATNAPGPYVVGATCGGNMPVRANPTYDSGKTCYNTIQVTQALSGCAPGDYYCVPSCTKTITLSSQGILQSDGSCRIPVCGDGIEDAAEQCDDGNTANGDGCSSICRDEPAVCGNTRCETGETMSNCPSDCTPKCDSSLLARYAFDEAKWTGAVGEVRDSKGTYHGTAIYIANTTAGAFGRAALVDPHGTGGYVRMNSMVNPATNNVSVAFWTRSGNWFGSYVHNQRGEFYISKYDYFNASVKLSDGNWYSVVDSAVSNAYWNHVVMTWGKGKLTLYVNGRSTTQNIPNLALFNAGTLLTIGENAPVSTLIDEFQVFDRTLTANEVAYLYNNGKGRTLCDPNPVCGNGKFEEGEACDDGNTNSNDGCSASCTIEGLLPTVVFVADMFKTYVYGINVTYLHGNSWETRHIPVTDYDQSHLKGIYGADIVTDSANKSHVILGGYYFTDEHGIWSPARADTGYFSGLAPGSTTWATDNLANDYSDKLHQIKTVTEPGNILSTYHCKEGSECEKIATGGSHQYVMIDKDNNAHVAMISSGSNINTLMYCSDKTGTWTCEPVESFPAKEQGDACSYCTNDCRLATG